ncbi:MAG: helix-turn-helix transcriptional regulator [Oscillospiraceae bacterium]|nr:helix-turn-helix transcriptional regulator [Oscillospiraceae bacterium]
MKLSSLKKSGRFPSNIDPDNVDVMGTMYSYLRDMGKDPDNFYQELDMDSRFVDARRDSSSPASAPAQLHSHGFYELIFCRTSCGVEYLVGTERFRLLRGDIMFIPPGISHRLIYPSNMSETYKRYVIWISQEFMDAFFRLCSSAPSRLSSSLVIRTSGTQWAALRELFQRNVIEQEQRSAGWEAAAYGYTMLLLSQLERAVSEDSAPFLDAEQPELIDSLIDYIESHLDKRLTLSGIAEHFYISESTVTNIFRSKLGTSFHRIVIQRRLVAAKDLIVRGMALEEVAARTGFGDYSSFFRAFRTEYGISPSRFRAMREHVSE